MGEKLSKVSLPNSAGTTTIYEFKDRYAADTRITEEELALIFNKPEWNGTDLTGTTWNIPSGWSATSGYGKFNIADGQGDMQVDGEDFIHGGYIGIGYTLSSSMRYTAKQDCFVFGESLFGWGGGTNAQAFVLTIDGGADATNSNLITWLKANGSLTSHVMPTMTFTINGTSYQAEDGMTWGEWIASKYNTAGYLIEDPYVKFPPASGAMVGPYVSTSTSGATNYFVEITDTILANTTYYHINYGGGAGN